MTSFVIRRLRREDLPEVVAILAHWNMAPVAPSASCPTVERTELEPEAAFVAVDGERVVGVASYWLRGGGWGETAVLAVHPEWLRQGIGGHLHAARVEEMRRLGATRVRTETDRPEVIAWYQRRFGCRITGATPKKHEFSLPEVNYWTVLEQDLR